MIRLRRHDELKRMEREAKHLLEELKSQSCTLEMLQDDVRSVNNALVGLQEQQVVLQKALYTRIDEISRLEMEAERLRCSVRYLLRHATRILTAWTAECPIAPTGKQRPDPRNQFEHSAGR